MSTTERAKLPKHLIEELDRLTAKLVQADVEERHQIMRHLEQYEKSGKVPLAVLMEMADEENPTVSMYAITALGRNGGPEAVAKLLELLEGNRQGNPMFLETIVEALSEAGDKSASESLLGLLGIKSGWKGKLLGLVRKKGDDDTEAALREAMVLPVVKALAQIADPQAARLLGELLGHDDPLVRWHTLKALGDTGVGDFNERVYELAEKDQDEMVREMAEITLDKLRRAPRPLN